MKFLKSRFPSLKQALPVYAVIVVFLYTWSLLRFFWRLPSFVMSLTLGEIGVIFSYLMSVDFIESLIVIFALLLLGAILPASWYRARFAAQGALLAALGLWYLNYIYEIVSPGAPLPPMVFWSPLVGLGIFALSFLLSRFERIRRLLEDLTDRLLVFLYLSLPISAVSLLVVLLRNLF